LIGFALALLPTPPQTQIKKSFWFAPGVSGFSSEKELLT
jgi:hypothetical protein